MRFTFFIIAFFIFTQLSFAKDNYYCQEMTDYIACRTSVSLNEETQLSIIALDNMNTIMYNNRVKALIVYFEKLNATVMIKSSMIQYCLYFTSNSIDFRECIVDKSFEIEGT